MAKQTKKHFGYVALLGATNAGKSTLLNALTVEKVAIVSRKVQTTRWPIRGIVEQGDTQICFIDTPGVFEAKGAFDRRMVSAAWAAMDEADAVLFVLDAQKGMTPTFTRVAEKLKTLKTPIALVINKVDAVKKPVLLELTGKITAEYGGLFDSVFMVSALKNDGLDKVLAWAASKMPEAGWEFEGGMHTDASLGERLAELTREQVYDSLHQELPYGIAVRTDKIEGRNVHQTIITNEKKHRGMILGAKGAMIRRIGERARAGMAGLLGGPTSLFLTVEVDKDWKN